MLKKKLITSIAALALASLTLVACSSGGPAPSDGDGASNGSDNGDNSEGTQELQDASILMNWFAQAEQGGYWAAQAEGFAKENGLNLTIKQGGPGIQTNPQIASGKADFGIGNADEIIQASSEGLPLVAVAASFDHSLQGMLYHESTGIKGFADLKGHTVSRMPLPYWSYISKKFDLEGNIHEVNLQSLSSFQENEDMVLQCYITSEPFALEEAGVSGIGVLTSSEDGGYDPYQNLIYTTQDFIDKHPDIVQAVVNASVQGWKAMLKDPEATKKAIMEANPDGDEYVLDHAVKFMQDNPSLFADDFGTFDPARWEELRDQLASVGIVPKDFDVTKAYTSDFVDKATS